MRKINSLILVFSTLIFLCTTLSFAQDVVKEKTLPDIKAEKEEPFLWDLIFSNTKSVVPMVSTSTEIALSPYPPYFSPVVDVLANQKRFTTGDRMLIQSH